MAYSVENIEKAVRQFYYEASAQQEAHAWLTTAQLSPDAWSFSWHLLMPDKGPEVQFFGASCLHVKISRYLHELPAEKLEELRKQLFERLLSFANGPKMVLTRLCVAMSALSIQTTPEMWTDAVVSIITTFQQAQLPNVESSRLCTILLELLTVLPEEFFTANLSKVRRGSVRYELNKGLAHVIPLLQSVMVPSSPPEVYDQAMKCFSSWVQFGIPLNESVTLVQQVFDALNNTDIFDTAIECLVNVFQQPEAYRYPISLKVLFVNILSLQGMLQKAIGEHDVDSCHSICRLVVTAAENHTKLILECALGTEEEKLHAMNLINLVMQCSAMPGHFPTDETCSELAFGFWYILQDDIMSSDHELFQQYIRVFAPVYMSLVQVFLGKVAYPPEAEYVQWSKEEKEQFRCYRQDIGDGTMYAYNILRQPLLAYMCSMLCSLAEKSSLEEISWQNVEAAFYLLSSIADNVEFEENVSLPIIFSILPRIPFNNLTLISTALVMIGAYAEWMNFHAPLLGGVLPLLLQGLNNSEMAMSATMALKDITRECQDHIAGYANQILTASQEALASNVMKSRECIRLMSSVGHVLSICPLADIIQYLNSLLTPHLQQLQQLVEQPPSASVRNCILLKVNMLSTLFGSLNTNREESDEEGREKPKETPEEPQPVMLILQQVMPVIKAISAKWIADAAIVEAVCDMYKRALRSLMDDFSPLAEDVSQMVAEMYTAVPHSHLLDLAKQLLVLFMPNDSYKPIGQRMFLSLVARTICLAENGAKDNPDVIETFTSTMAQLLKKCHCLFMDETCNLLGIFQIGVVGMVLQENPTVKSSCFFMAELINSGEKIPPICDIIRAHGQALVERLLRAIGGESPRAVVDHMCDVLQALNKKYSEYSRQWLADLMANEGFPTAKVSAKDKETFVKFLLRERNNKRKTRELVKEFSLNCRGLIGTEYGAQDVTL
ncbi:importin-13-like isoform X2 [Lineus longissimus]|uniref:importin-13-like isoform X2 n=1 Tax=Lineus longissimus TaxID=88925 RepID=UPI002B4E9CB4